MCNAMEIQITRFPNVLEHLVHSFEAVNYAHFTLRCQIDVCGKCPFRWGWHSTALLEQLHKVAPFDAYRMSKYVAKFLEISQCSEQI